MTDDAQRIAVEREQAKELIKTLHAEGLVAAHGVLAYIPEEVESLVLRLVQGQQDLLARLAASEAREMALTTALQNQTKRACMFNCDAVSGCECIAHMLYREATCR